MRASDRNKRTLIIGAGIVLVLVVFLLVLSLREKNYINNIDTETAFQELGIQKLDSSYLSRTIELAGDYLIRSLKENGRFIYKVNLDTGIAVNEKYNTLRHAGAIYALCMYYEHSKDPAALEAAVKAAGFIRDSLLYPIDGNPHLMGIWSLGRINNDKDPPLVKLGGNGLGLVALAYLEKIKPGTTDTSVLNKIGNMILFMQKKNGGFYSKYFPGKRGLDDSWTSLYYPGEAALGLLMLYEIDGNKKWLNGAARALRYLAKLRKGETFVEADHWALLATEKLLGHYNELELDIPAELFIEHGVQICKSMIMQMPQFPSFSPYYGCMTPDGRTTPTSTRMEGLLSIVYVIPKERQSLIYSNLLVCNKGIGFTQRAMVNKGPYSGGVTRALCGPGVEPERFGITPDSRRESEIRIDYVQHALSAWIQYYNLVFGEK